MRELTRDRLSLGNSTKRRFKAKWGDNNKVWLENLKPLVHWVTIATADFKPSLSPDQVNRHTTLKGWQRERNAHLQA